MPPGAPLSAPQFPVFARGAEPVRAAWNVPAAESPSPPLPSTRGRERRGPLLLLSPPPLPGNMGRAVPEAAHGQGFRAGLPLESHPSPSAGAGPSGPGAILPPGGRRRAGTWQTRSCLHGACGRAGQEAGRPVPLAPRQLEQGEGISFGGPSKLAPVPTDRVAPGAALGGAGRDTSSGRFAPRMWGV